MEEPTIVEAAKDTSAAPSFFLELVDDRAKNHVRGSSNKYQPKSGKSHELSTGHDPVDGIPNYEAGDVQASRPYFSFVCSTIQIVKPGRVLVVWHATFDPGLDKRFKSAVIGLQFLKPVGSKVVPSIVAHAPHKAYGGVSKESKTVHWGVELPISVPAGPASVGLTPGWSVDMSKDVEHTFTITGSSRGGPRRTNCIWTVDENDSSRRGIPSEIQFATFLDHDEPFICQVDVSACTPGGWLGPRWLRTSTPADKRQTTIDPRNFVGLLKEYDFGGDSRKCDEMLKKWTGEVEGAVVLFEQPVVGN